MFPPKKKIKKSKIAKKRDEFSRTFFYFNKKIGIFLFALNPKKNRIRRLSTNEVIFK